MKPFLRILIVLSLALFISSSVCFGQVLGQQKRSAIPFSGQNTSPLQKNLKKYGFRLGLDWYQYAGHHHNDKAQNAFQYHIDTAVVRAGGEFPQRYIYAYDSAGNKVSVLSQTLRHDSWTNASLDTMTYDSAGNRLTDLVKVWNNDAWQNLSLTVSRYRENRRVQAEVNKVWKDDAWDYTDSSYYYYNANDNQVASFNAIWVDSLSSWVNRSFNIYAFDSLGYRQFSVFEQWYDSGWVNTQKVEFSYDSVYNLTEGLILNWGDTAWVNYYRENYLYDSLGSKIGYTGQDWDSTDSLWKNDLHYDYRYNAYNQLEVAIGKVWNDSIWQNFEKGEYTYARYGGIETYLHQQWFDGDTSWQNSSLSLYNYDTAGNAYQGKYLTWDTAQQAWIQNLSGLMQIYYNYGTQSAFYTGYQVNVVYNKPLSTGISQLQEPVLRFGCAPNPAQHTTKVLLDIKNAVFSRIEVYDITGRKMTTVFRGNLEKGNHSFQLNTDNYPAGLYFVSVRTGNTAKTIKLVVNNN